VAKKWHVAKRLVHKIKEVTGIETIEYLFDEASCPMPDLGGIQTQMSKRARHRRALMRMLFEYYDTDRMVVCMDPKNMEMFQDFFADRCTTRLLEIESVFTDDYLAGHAIRIGLAGENTSKAAMDRLLPTIRADVTGESDRIRDAGFQNYYRISELREAPENALAISQFLSIQPDEALQIAQTNHLFED
jgi:hypothetical protein